MPAQHPLVSAIIPTHNRADLLPRALDSALVQTYEPLEIIVVDDGSTDYTPQVVKEYAEQASLNYIRLEDSGGAPHARNTGIEAARGLYIAGLDDDDKWHEERIARLVDAYSDEFSFVTSDELMIYPNLSRVWKKRKKITLRRLLYTNQVGNQGLVARERLLEVGGFDESLPAAQDYDLWVQLCAKYGPIKNVQESLQTVYMNHQKGRITEKSSVEGYLKFYQKHKHRMNRNQRAYKLYNIRRAQGKADRLCEFLQWVPPFRYWKEIKRKIRGAL